MSQAAAQTIAVDEDRPCTTCGYNLRGQTAAWERATSRWRATCPECGAAQAIVASGPAVAASWVTVALIGVGAWLGWLALTTVAAGVARMMATPASTANAALTTAAARARAAVAVPPSVFDADGQILMSHFALNLIPLALAAAAFGAIIATSPFAKGRQMLILMLSAVGIAWLVGVWMSVSGYALGDDDIQSAVLRAFATINGGRIPPGAATPAVEWQWKFVSATAALLIATLAARAGLAVGRPLAAMLRQMYLPPDDASPSTRQEHR